MLHSRTLLSVGFDGEAYEVFRAACAVTNPMWTQCGPDPQSWHAPADAAGGLVIWDAHGELIRVEPPRQDEDAAAAEAAYNGLLAAGGVVGIVRASYASSGGRMVALCAAYGRWWITVSRMGSAPRIGATEEAIRRADPECTMFGLVEYIDSQ